LANPIEQRQFLLQILNLVASHGGGL
jgi:hypothetical protein